MMVQLYFRDDKEANKVREIKSIYYIVAPKNDFNIKMDKDSRAIDPAIFEKYYDIELNCFRFQLVTCWELEKD